MFSLCAAFSVLFLARFKAVEKSVFNEDIRDMSFSPNTKRNAFTENTESATEENRFITSRKSLSSFRCSFSRSLSRLSFRSLSFSSRKAFVVVPLLKDLVAKRERFAVKLFQIRNSYAELGIIRTSAEPTARHPTHRVPTFRALLWCSATNSSGLVFVFFFARKVCSRWSYSRE